VAYGGWSTINWSVANAANGCTTWSNPSTSFGGITGAGSGAVPVGPLSANTTFHVRCDNGNGAIAENYTGVSVGAPPPPPPPLPPPPTAQLSASPATIALGARSTLTWSSSDASSCSTSWAGTQAASGSQSVAPVETTTYTLTCNGASAATTVTVTPPPANPAYYDGFVTADVLRNTYVFRLGCASVGDGVRRIKGDGRLIWRYNLRILEFCWNGLTITRLNGVEVVEERVQPPFPFSLYQSITYKEENRNFGEAGGRITVVSVSGRFEYCGAGFICIPIGNPWIRIELSATGQATCTTSVRPTPHACFRW
jgi:hypothetical protein